ncbi:BglG family transcription antiterminator [Maledivibacter halophilus]|uniref:Transcriptional antiterminator n=1 Tax=Maledivibacter halophilus TaxID=36842 RepID=A0A1T5MPC6_9FIRM|nr:PRD domain-containing protein [Maledivibacter halophilus]SKC90080.1 Transcriptional antiterminator [Maledivibacter halophilus]
MNARIPQIIKILLNDNEIKTIAYVADKLKVSNKTIRNDLKSVGKLLSENNLRLIKKTGVGIYIEGDEKAKLKMITNVKSYKQMSSHYTSRDRQLYILNQLLTSNKKITTSTLQNELFISRPSVYKDLEKVKEWLKERDIDVVADKRKGLILKAGEKRIRKAMFDLFFLSEDYDEMLDAVEKTSEYSDSNYAAINYFSYCQKEDILGLDYEKVNNIILGLEDKFNIKFTATDLSRLTVKYSLAISRMMDKKYVKMKESTLKDLQELDKYEKMIDVAHEIEREFNTIVPVEEIGYLFGITIVSKTHFDDIDWNISEKMLVINKIVAKDIIELTKESYHISDEETFYNGLIHHLKSVTNKIKYGLDFHNTLVDEIKKNYAEPFEIALKSKSIFEEYYSYEIPIEEVGYIALHIAAAIERSKKSISTYIVYHSSYSEIKLMIEILRNNFNQLKVKKVIPISMIDDINHHEVDLIITTQKLEESDSKIVVLPTVLVNEDMDKFSKILRDIYEKQNDKNLRKFHK